MADSQEKREMMFLGMGYIHMKRKRQQRRQQHRRRWWVHPINVVRPTEGAWVTLIKKFITLYPEKHQQCMRVTKDCFEEILKFIQPAIQKTDTVLRRAIPPDQRLCVTLMFLSTGDSFKTLALLFRLGESTVREIIYNTCQAIWLLMKDKYMKTPSTTLEWEHIADGFNKHWNFPNCIGAVDGKHVAIQAPPNTGSEYFNYKKHFSIVLMATCDAMYRFTYVDVGAAGRWSDGGTFDNCSLNRMLSENKLNIPAPRNVPGKDDKPLPFVFVGDEAFPLKPWMMRPFPGRVLDTTEKKVFNYRLSRARRTIENSFGILVARWRCLRNSLHMLPKHSEMVVLACCILHNYMRTESANTYTPPGYCDTLDVDGNLVDGAWRAEQVNNEQLVNTVCRNATTSAVNVRNEFVQYFNNEGALPWQRQYVSRTA